MNATPDRWLPIPGYERYYEVSDQGRVRSLDRVVNHPSGPRRLKGRILKPQLTGVSGVHVVYLSMDGRVWRRAVSKLVLEAFVGPKPKGMDCCHRNDDAADNRLINLRWDTHRSNMLDQVRNGIHGNASKTRCPKEHEFTPENTYITTNGGRSCLKCKREYNRAYYQATKAMNMQKVSA